MRPGRCSCRRVQPPTSASRRTEKPRLINMHQELAWLTAAEQQAAMTAGEVTAVQLCELYLQRISAITHGCVA